MIDRFECLTVEISEPMAHSRQVLVRSYINLTALLFTFWKTLIVLIDKIDGTDR